MRQCRMTMSVAEVRQHMLLAGRLLSGNLSTNRKGLVFFALRCTTVFARDRCLPRYIFED